MQPKELRAKEFRNKVRILDDNGDRLLEKEGASTSTKIERATLTSMFHTIHTVKYGLGMSS